MLIGLLIALFAQAAVAQPLGNPFAQPTVVFKSREIHSRPVSVGRNESTRIETMPVEPAQIARWVAALGDSNFRVREFAEKRLVRAGLATEPALSDAAESSDLEVRYRAQRVLEVVRQAHLDRLLVSFVEGGAITDESVLPCWAKFRELLGDEPHLRELYVGMLRSERRLLELCEQRPSGVAEVFRRTSQAEELWSSHRLIELNSAETLPALLFVAGDPRVQLDERSAELICSVWEYSSEALDQFDRQAVKLLLSRWLEHPGSKIPTSSQLMLAARYQLSAGLKPAIEQLKASGKLELEYSAFVVLSQSGRIEHLPLLEKYFRKSRVCHYLELPSREIAIECRDAALSTAVQLTGQKLDDYGFITADDPDTKLTVHAFSNHADRGRAFKKWTAWAEKNSKQDGAAKGNISKVEELGEVEDEQPISVKEWMIRHREKP